MGWVGFLFVFFISFFSIPNFNLAFGHDPAQAEPDVRVHADGQPIISYTDPDLEVPLRNRVMKVVDYHLSKYEHLPSRVKDKITMVYDELVRNVFMHAHKGDLDKRISVRVFDTGGNLFLQVSDEGGSFYDPENKKDPRNDTRSHKAVVSEEEVVDSVDKHKAHPAGGRGLLFLNKFTQGFKYEPHKIGGRLLGTTVTVKFRLRSGWQKFLDTISSATCSQAIIFVPPHPY